MTATYPARTQRAYRGVIYGLDVLDHETGQVVHDDYVGKTRQRGKLRELQHRDRQPFSDRIVGEAHVLWEGVCTDEQLDEMERRFIQDVERRPRLNVELNEDNRHRIPKKVQIAQRHERDARLGRKPWVPYEQRTRESLLEWDTPDRPSYDRASPVRQSPVAAKPWSPVKKRIVGWGIAWPVSTLVLWLLALLKWHLGGWVQTLGWSASALPAAVTGFCLAVLFFGKPRTRRTVWRRPAGRAR